jgi:Arc/MetJ-type ribon-helix-helix transcriptional regulator
VWGRLRGKASSVISLKVDVKTLTKIELLVRKGYFRSKSDVIRAAIRAKIEKERALQNET